MNGSGVLFAFFYGSGRVTVNQRSDDKGAFAYGESHGRFVHFRSIVNGKRRGIRIGILRGIKIVKLNVRVVYRYFCIVEIKVQCGKQIVIKRLLPEIGKIAVFINIRLSAIYDFFRLIYRHDGYGSTCGLPMNADRSQSYHQTQYRYNEA